MATELQTGSGSFIVGYINLLWTIGDNIYSLYILGLGLNIMNTGDLSLVGETEDKEHAEAVGATLVIVAGISLVFGLIALMFAILLLVGLHKRKPGFLKAYLIFGTIYGVLMILGLFGSGGQTVLAIVIKVACIYCTCLAAEHRRAAHIAPAKQARMFRKVRPSRIVTRRANELRLCASANGLEWLDQNEVEGADDFTENYNDMLVPIVSLETAHDSPWIELE